MAAVAVMGAGAWGTAFAHRCLAGGHPVTLWARDGAAAARIAASRRNPRLPAVRLADELVVTGDPAQALRGAELVVLAIPSVGLAAQLEAWGRLVPDDVTVVSLTKGLDAVGPRFPSQVVRDVLGGDPGRVVVVSGPNLADEVAAGRPSATVAASPDEGRAGQVRSIASGPGFRVYTNRDRTGVEVAGVVKNVLAIVAGAARGLGYGDNTAAMILTRGLAEMTRLGTALGADPRTFLGLAGVGDLVVTCTSPGSRNRTLGERLAAGEELADVVASMGAVAEGVRAAPLLAGLAHRLGVDMPMVDAVVAVTRDGAAVREEAERLLARPALDELPGHVALAPEARAG